LAIAYAGAAPVLTVVVTGAGAAVLVEVAPPFVVSGVTPAGSESMTVTV
jgi:hypothetical protein